MSTPYRVLVTGSRDWSNQAIVWQAIASTVIANTTPDTPVVIVHGACPTGADAYAAVWAGLGSVAKVDLGRGMIMHCGTW